MKLPLFPLSEVLYPGELLPLHIFEERYRQMTAYCLQQDTPFGILCMNDGRMAKTGCSARIRRVVQRYDDGRLDILVEGEARFQWVSLHKDCAYLTGEINWFSESNQLARKGAIERVIAQHMRLMEIAGRAVRPDLYESSYGVSWVIGRNAGLTLTQKQELLEITSEKARIEFLIEHLEVFIPRVEQTSSLRQKIMSNGHFKDFPPEHQ